MTARYVDARRYAVGPDTGGVVAWLLDAPWQPTGGAWPWLLSCLAGAGLIAAAPLVRRGIHRREGGVTFSEAEAGWPGR